MPITTAPLITIGCQLHPWVAVYSFLSNQADERHLVGTLPNARGFLQEDTGKTTGRHFFFKHKYITQPTVTPADAIVNAFTKLRDAIQGIQHSKDDAHFEALRRLEQTLQSQNKQSIKTGEQVKLPRVEH
jgi:hypothetical protein